jgi:hypothetical protein
MERILDELKEDGHLSSPFQTNPIGLVELLSPGQHFNIAWRSYVRNELLFSVGKLKEYEELLKDSFRLLFDSKQFGELSIEAREKKRTPGYCFSDDANRC